MKILRATEPGENKFLWNILQGLDGLTGIRAAREIDNALEAPLTQFPVDRLVVGGKQRLIADYSSLIENVYTPLGKQTFDFLLLAAARSTAFQAGQVGLTDEQILLQYAPILDVDPLVDLEYAPLGWSRTGIRLLPVDGTTLSTELYVFVTTLEEGQALIPKGSTDPNDVIQIPDNTLLVSEREENPPLEP